MHPVHRGWMRLRGRNLATGSICYTADRRVGAPASWLNSQKLLRPAKSFSIGTIDRWILERTCQPRCIICTQAVPRNVRVIRLNAKVFPANICPRFNPAEQRAGVTSVSNIIILRFPPRKIHRGEFFSHFFSTLPKTTALNVSSARRQ